MLVGYDAASLLNPKTGIGHYAATLLEELLLLDPEIRFNLFALTRNPSDPLRGADPRCHLKHVRLPARLVVTMWELAGTPDGSLITGDVDIVHGTNYWLPPTKRSNGIVTIHDLTFIFYPELCTPQVQRYRWILPRVLKRSALVITPCQTIRAQVIEELGVPEDRVRVTPYGVRGAFKEATVQPELSARLGIVKPYILFAGTQEPRKNLDRLIEAFELMGDPDLQLVIAGPPGWGSTDLPAVARNRRLQDRIVFSGYLTDPELGALMVGARAFAFPSLYEGFGLPPLEAMAAGIPVVAASAGSLPEVLGDAPFWCDPLDVGSIGEALTRAVTDPQARQEAIRRGRIRAEGYTWAETAELTLDAYKMVSSG